MIVKKVETKVYTEHAYCECGGEFKSENTAYQRGTGPTVYYHICNKCNNDTFLDDIYPRLVYEEVKES